MGEMPTMERALFSTLHRLNWWACERGHTWISDAILSRICPYPIYGNFTAQSCNKAGHCGCSKLRRSPPLPTDSNPGEG
jgi:hypothetical protein